MKRRSKKIDFDPARAAAALLAAAAPMERPDISVAVGASIRSPHVLQIAGRPILVRTAGMRRTSGSIEPLLLNPHRTPDLAPDLFAHPIAHTVPFFAEAAPALVRGYLDLVDATIAMTRKTSIPSLELPKNIHFTVPRLMWKPAYAFAIIALLLIIPFVGGEVYARLMTVRDNTLTAGRAAVASLQNAEAAAATGDLAGVQIALDDARAEFESMPRLIRSFGDAGNLLEAGELFSKNAATLTRAFRDLGPSSNLLFKTTALRNALEESLPGIARAADLIEKTDAGTVPPEYRDRFDEFKHRIPALRTSLESAVPLANLGIALLGADEPRRYLVVFQNNAELRPTGGFIGSFAEVTVSRGEITKLTVPPGGSYDLQGMLKVAVIPPEPIAQMIPRWEFHDANWFPDFPASARKLQWFYEKSGGPTTDGVIALTASVLPDLLRATGPIKLSDGRTVTAENVIDTINKSIDVAKDRGSRAPKQILSLLAPALLERILALSPEQFGTLPSVLGAALAEKKIMISLANKREASLLARQGWDGALAVPKDKDFLAVVHTNIGGGKADAVTTTNIEHGAMINADGTVVDTVKIRRTHNGTNGDHRFGRTNVDYLRVYVPEGSELLAVGGDIHRPGTPELADSLIPDPDLGKLEREVGIEPISNTRVTHEFGATVYANWLAIPPGESKEISFTYRVPSKPANRRFKIALFDKKPEAYELVVWKQPGADNTTIETRVTYAAEE